MEGLTATLKHAYLALGWIVPPGFNHNHINAHPCTISLVSFNRQASWPSASRLTDSIYRNHYLFAFLIALVMLHASMGASLKKILKMIFSYTSYCIPTGKQTWQNPLEIGVSIGTSPIDTYFPANHV